MDKKGFFFVIVAFVLLSYILASTYIWVRAIEMEESRYSESFRTSSMEMLVDQLDKGSVSEMANVMANYAFYKIDNHSINSPVVPEGAAGSEAEFDNIKFAMRDLMLTGVTEDSDHYFEYAPLVYTEEEIEDYTLHGWGTKLNGSLAASGFELEKFEIHEDTFTFNQTDYLVYEVNFTMDIVIRDLKAGSATSMTRTYEISTIVNATGMVDPYIARESKAMNFPNNQVAEKQAFMAPLEFDYPGRGDIGYSEDYPAGYPPEISEAMSDAFTSLCSEDSGDCYYIESGNAGQGWFYGPMVSAEDSEYIAEILETGNAGQYILVGNYSEITSVGDYSLFGAYILTNEPTEDPDSACAGKSNEEDTFNALLWEDDCDAIIDSGETRTPFAVDDGFEMQDYIGDREDHKVLFVSRYSVSEVENSPELKIGEVAFYDVEMFRDFVICGYYLPREESPSFLQRMFDIGATDAMREGGLFGIETTVVGNWAGGNLSPAWDPYSRVEIEFFGEPQLDGIRIMGMPGCKNPFFCREDSESEVGRFRISADSLERYNIQTTEDGISAENIACKDDGSEGNDEHAGCENEE